MKILVINGPNLNLLGLREPAIYGSQSYAALLEKIQAFCDKEGVEVSFRSSSRTTRAPLSTKFRRPTASMTASSSTPPPTLTPA